jgi:hypothetical protein
MKEMINTYDILARDLEGKMTRGRPGHVWEDNIKLDLKM